MCTWDCCGAPDCPKRVEMAARLTRSTFALSLSAISRQHPQWDEQRCRLKMVEMLYGPELAEGVRQKLGVG